jgi:hypothetical protein
MSTSHRALDPCGQATALVVAVAVLLAFAQTPRAAAQDAGDCSGPGSAVVDVQRLGPAVEGFPVNSALLLGDDLHIASMDITPLRLLRYDTTAQRVTGQTTVDSSRRAWRMAAAGGQLYVGLWDVPQDETNFIRVDPDSGAITRLPRIPAQLDVTAMTAGPDGRVYTASDQPETVFAYEEGSEALTEINVPDSPDNVVGALAATPEHLYVGMRNDHAALYELELATGQLRSVLPAAAAGAMGIGSLSAADGMVVAGTTGGHAQLLVLYDGVEQVVDVPGEVAIETSVVHDGAVWFAGKPSGTLYRYDPATRALTTAARPVPDSPVRYLGVTGDRIIGVNAAETVWTYDPASGAVASTDLVAAGAPGQPVSVMSLAVGAGRVFAGANNRLQVRSLATGGVQRVTVVGEPKDLAASGREVLMAMYPYAQLRAYDAEQGSTRLVTAWDADYNRPRDLTWLTRNRLLIGTRADDAGGGALIDHDRTAGTTRVHRDPLGSGRAVATVEVAADEVYIGSDGPTAVVAAWDARTAHTGWSTAPVPNGGTIAGLAVHGDRVWGTTHRGWVFSLDRLTGAVMSASRPLTAPTGEMRATQSALYAVSAAAVVHIDPVTAAPTVLTDGLQAQVFERPRLAIDDDCALYAIAGSDIARLTSRE